MLARNFVKTAIAVGVCGFVSTNALASDVTVYGKVKIDYGAFNKENYASVTTQDNWELSSRSSRFGIKGDYDITDTLKVIYLYEFGVDVTDGGSDDDTLSSRNSYIGLQDNWGTVLAGRYDTALKKSYYSSIGTIDLFDDDPIGDYTYSFVGDDRIDNQLVYQSPKYAGGLQYSLQIQPGEDSGADNSSGNDDNAADGFSGSIAYTSGKIWYIAAAYNNNVKNADTTRLSGIWNIGNVQLGAMYQYSENHDNTGSIGKKPKGLAGTMYNGMDIDSQNAYLLSVGIHIEKWLIKAQYTGSSNSLVASGYDDVDLYTGSIGTEYKFSSRLKTYLNYSYGSGEANESGNDDSVDQSLLIGTEFKF